MKPLVLLAVAWLAMAPRADGAEVLSHDIEFKDEHYILKLDMRLKSKRDRVYAVMIDFNNLTTLSDSIKVSELLFSHNKVHTVRLESEGCVLFFCRRVKQVQLVSELGDWNIHSLTDPDESDLRFGEVHWQLYDEGEYTRIRYHADYVPDFWVPPLFGPAIFKSRLMEEAQKTMNGIEHRANLPPPDPPAPPH